MTATSLNSGGGTAGAARWAKRTAAVVSCAGLAIALGLVFTRVIAARVPQQRATLEKLITEHTGLAVRFDDVRLAWKLDGASAVFTRVELKDPKAGRVRVTAPELRVELDTWDFLRHQQMTLGQVKLTSPDIEITGDAEGSVLASISGRDPGGDRRTATHEDEAAAMRRYLSWAELMPVGRIEVEGARVHLKRRGEPAPRHSFTLSQAVVSRGSAKLNAHGTLLLAQDFGQSLFVSAKLDGLRAGANVSGDLRFIARRVMLERLPIAGLQGRGTIDAKLRLENGRISSANWQASARELRLRDEAGPRFDHLVFNGKLARDAQDVLLAITDLQVTRGAQLDRAPRLDARFKLRRGTTQVSGATLQAVRLPYLASELLAGLLAPQLDLGPDLPEAPLGWQPFAGVLRDMRIETAVRDGQPIDWELSAEVSGAGLQRTTDTARVSDISARLRGDSKGFSLEFDPADAVNVILEPGQPARTWAMSGAVSLHTRVGSPAWSFEGFTATSGASTIGLSGSWPGGTGPASVATLQLAQVDRTLLRDTQALLAPQSESPDWWKDVEDGNILAGSFELVPDAAGEIDWARSKGGLTFSTLGTTGEFLPRLASARGALSVARGGTRLDVEGGKVDDLAIRKARIDWPRRGAPRLQAALDGDLESSLLREVLRPQGLEGMTGAVSIEVDARGAEAFRHREQWRVTARLRDASLNLGEGMPIVESLAGTIHYSGKLLRDLELSGRWLGGPLQIKSRRGAARSALAFAGSGEADAASLVALLGAADAASQVSGEISWNGAAEFNAENQLWNVSLTSNLAGMSSELPRPLDKSRARQVPVTANLVVAPDGIRQFELESGPAIAIRGESRDGDLVARFDVHGVTGEWQHPSDAARNHLLQVEALDLRSAPALLAGSGSLLPRGVNLSVTVNDLRAGAEGLGVLHAAITHQESSVQFSLNSPAATLHQLKARGACTTGQGCRAEFAADTAHLDTLLRSVRLPAEWPTSTLRAAGTLQWPADAQAADVESLSGAFSIQAQGMAAEHQLTAQATLQGGEILLGELQGTGPEPDEVFRGHGRVDLVARNYDMSVEYEKVALAATAVPSTARARLAHAWNALRGSAARQGWTPAPVARQVRWHGTWEAER